MVEADRDRDTRLNQPNDAERNIIEHTTDVGQRVVTTLQESTSVMLSDMLRELKVSIYTSFYYELRSPFQECTHRCSQSAAKLRAPSLSTIER